MGFSITFTDVSTNDMQYGVIELDSLREKFEASLSYWNVWEYEKQWKEGLNRVARGLPTSCLVTSMYDPHTANFVLWWLLYRVGEEVFIQNQVLFLDELGKPFDPSNPYIAVPSRITVNDDGQKISEWSVSVEKIKEFLQTAV